MADVSRPEMDVWKVKPFWKREKVLEKASAVLMGTD
jgi:hypothetical protein